MATVTNYENLAGEPMVMVVNDDGSVWSGYKEAYDYSTLPSELVDPALAEKSKK
jgi:hypothetical protein